jgi:hypothetical protein
MTERGHIEDNVIRTAGQPYQRIMLRGWHDKSFCALDLVVKARHARRGVIRNDIAPKLRPKADDEVHSSCGGPWFTDRGDCRSELLASLCVQKVKLQIRMRGRSKSEDSSLGRVHAGIISGSILTNTTELDRVATAAVRRITNNKRISHSLLGIWDRKRSVQFTSQWKNASGSPMTVR